MIIRVFCIFCILCSLVIEAQAQAYRLNNLTPRYKVWETSNKDTVDIYMFAGQSNMVGRDTLTNLSQEYNYLLDTLPEKITITNDGEIFSRLVMSRAATNTNGGDEGDVKPETSFADTLYKSSPHEMYIYKYAIGGTQLAKSDTVTDWNAKSTSEIYDALLEGLRRVEQKIRIDGKIPNLEAFFWMQGEQDRGTADSLTYEANLDTLFLSLRDEVFPENPDLKIIIGMVRGNDANIVDPASDAIVLAQKAVSRYEENSLRLVSDTPYLRDKTYLIYTIDFTTFDGLHFDADSVVDFGWRMYTAYKYLISL